MFKVVQGKQTKDTLSCPAILRFVQRYTRDRSLCDGLIIDPFARNCLIGVPYTNDINPNTEANHHMDALDFLALEWGHKFRIGILDPPFSQRQNKEAYGENNLYTVPGKMKKIEIALGNKIELGGHIIKFGYNSNYSHRGYELVDGILVQYGGSINDTIVSVHEKIIPDIMELES